MSNTLREQLELFHPNREVERIAMTLEEYSAHKDWPIPFGMTGETKGFMVTYENDESTTWLEAEPHS